MFLPPLWDWPWGSSEMIKLNINLSSKPFVNNRKFFMIAGVLLTLLISTSYWNISRYQRAHARLGQVKRLLAQDQAQIEKLEKQQQEIIARLQKPETAEFLDLVDYINRLIKQRTFSWTRLLNDLETLTPGNLQIVSIKPQVVGNEIVIEIVASGRSSRDYIEFIASLESSGKFYNVNPIYEDISKSPGLVGRLINVSVKYRGQT
jgi:type IV pilus assembly protein PilN